MKQLSVVASRSRSPNSNPRKQSKLASRLPNSKNMNYLISTMNPHSTNNTRNYYNTSCTNVYSRVDPCGQPMVGGRCTATHPLWNWGDLCTAPPLTSHGHGTPSTPPTHLLWNWIDLCTAPPLISHRHGAPFTPPLTPKTGGKGAYALPIADPLRSSQRSLSIALEEVIK